jgi:prepilin-type N-terminal cleavage/methylation domain-containing protein
MKLTNTKSLISRKGMTLIELTVVILVLLSLMSVLFIGARAWLRGSDRAAAALLIRNAQQGVRGHCNIMGVDTPAANTTAEWTALQPAETDGSGTVTVEAEGTLADAIFGPEKYVESATEGTPPPHPAAKGGTGAFTAAQTDFETVPGVGMLYMTSDSNLPDVPEFYVPEGLQ